MFSTLAKRYQAWRTRSYASEILDQVIQKQNLKQSELTKSYDFYVQKLTSMIDSHIHYFILSNTEANFQSLIKGLIVHKITQHLANHTFPLDAIQDALEELVPILLDIHKNPKDNSFFLLRDLALKICTQLVNKEKQVPKKFEILDTDLFNLMECLNDAIPVHQLNVLSQKGKEELVKNIAEHIFNNAGTGYYFDPDKKNLLFLTFGQPVFKAHHLAFQMIFEDIKKSEHAEKIIIINNKEQKFLFFYMPKEIKTDLEKFIKCGSNLEF